eukprot:9344189-Ditylum_brightwellii.AAC.1
MSIHYHSGKWGMGGSNQRFSQELKKEYTQAIYTTQQRGIDNETCFVVESKLVVDRWRCFMGGTKSQDGLDSGMGRTSFSKFCFCDFACTIEATQYKS